jgi:hypothetical protein
MDRSRRPLAAAVASAALLASLVVLGGGNPPLARASVPAGPPVFSTPTVFTNAFFPFAVGGHRVFTGRSGSDRTVLLDTFTADTRDFSWGGGTVTCRVMTETEFENGSLVEISRNYFAQADDGSVYYFGEIVDDYEDGMVVDHGGSWVVGTPAPSDPPGTQTTADPALFMPANPEVGDVYKPEDVPDGPEEEDRIVRTGVRVATAAGRYEGCLQVLERDVADDAFETKWYAPGVGVIKGKARGEKFGIVATTFLPAGDE